MQKWVTPKNKGYQMGNNRKKYGLMFLFVILTISRHNNGMYLFTITYERFKKDHFAISNAFLN
jgi:hypothetical protein